ncbi:MAG TPA: HD domain-containing phosphohydrolase [Candidatus Krumholzibacteria bacterium]|nr:HD domain-containing phosphohydrolase [Candidatus Krumholzibacteria bacterium]
MPPKTRIEKLSSPDPGVTVFKITGTLGFHEKAVLERIFVECNRRGLARVLFEVSELESLGGGCARIIREEASRGRVAIGLVGATRTVLKFLKKEDAPRIVVADSLHDGIPAINAKVLAFKATVATELESDDALLGESLDDILKLGDGPAEEEDASASESDEEEPVRAREPQAARADKHAPSQRAEKHEPSPAAGARDEKPAHAAAHAKPEAPRAYSPQEDRARRMDAKPAASRPSAPPHTAPRDEKPAPPRQETSAPARETTPSPAPVPLASANSGDARELQRRIVQYNTLFSINSDFYRLRDRKALLDAFLLTTIAQVGVESAVFLEHNRNYYVPVAMKGIEPGEMRGFALSGAQLKIEKWGGTVEVQAVEKSPFGDDVKAPLLALGCTYVAPFIVRGDVRGILLLGRPIRSELDHGAIEFLKILIHQAAVAYESMSRFEEENERTLGVVQTLMSLIEENTLARGNTNLIINYVYTVAQRMHYPAEHLRDLMYGAVLRDIGMIKVSDLIVRSPRELMPEEWEIIKRHPSEGAVMLRDMKFSAHAINVVLHHHERFNGEGYPRGTQGQDIPLGARIVSVVESYAAMLQERPTRPALGREEALTTLKENWGLRYDPEVVRCFVEVVEEEIRSGESIKEKKFALFSV